MKKLAVCLLALLVVSFSVSALAGTSKVLSGSSVQEEVSTAVADTLQPQQKTSSSKELEKTSSVVLTAQKDLEGTKVLKGDALAEHKENLEQLAEDYSLLEKYRNSVRPFVNGGIRVNFQENHPIFGVQASGGVRFSSGFTTGVTIGYKLVEISKAGIDWCKFGFGNWDAALTFGYSW